jgi:hypothetical protein
MKDPIGTRFSVEDAVAAITCAWAGSPAIIGTGTWSEQGHVRIGVLDVSGKRPALVWAGHVAAADVSELFGVLEAHGPCERGGLDFMYATPWKIAWTQSSERVRVFDRQRLRCEASEQGIVVHDRCRGQRSIGRERIRIVRATGHAFRIRSHVDLVLDDGSCVTAVAAHDLGAVFSDDPWAIWETWTVRVATALAGTLGIAIERRGDV